MAKVSATRATALANELTELAADLHREEPTVAMALRAGVKDKSYSTVANGWVLRYEGEAVVTLANGREYRCIGYGPRGDAYSIYRQGFVEFIWLNPDATTEEKICDACEVADYAPPPTDRASGKCASCGKAGPIGYPDDSLRVLHADVAGRLYCCECWEEFRMDDADACMPA